MYVHSRAFLYPLIETMTEQQQQTTAIFDNSTIPEIQSSSQVNPQFLLSTSSLPSPTTIDNNNVKRTSSRSRLGTDEVGGEATGSGGYYAGDMERFFQSEVRPVYFGKLNIIICIDNLLCLFV